LIEIDDQMKASLYSRLLENINQGKEALLDSEVDSPFKYNWSDNIKNLIAVPLWGKEKSSSAHNDEHYTERSIVGVMVAVNRLDKPDFDSIDVKLFNSVANECAVFIENGRLFNDLKELFIGSLKALTSSIDAKDKYTRGHSERVAYISKWIAERVASQENLDEEQIQRIYLAGLLHDMGKIGIDEEVLRKNGKLTDEEYGLIRKHPLIGAGILKEIKQMHDIVPGVLCHHERIDGKGYPNNLSNDKVPLIGRIIAIADTFDAMTSKRSYRDAMSPMEAIAEIERGLGTQFDKRIGQAFINSDISQLWETIQQGYNEIYGTRTFAEYGTIAVGALIK
jgi:HD-GYP domain-containing protein (c-di-GMP phosphodiesterase class II)